MSRGQLFTAVHDDAAWAYIAGHIDTLGYAPRLSDIARAVGFSKSAVFLCLRRLESRGVIRRVARLAQAIEVLAVPALPRAPDGAALHFISVDRLGSHKSRHNGSIGQDHA